MRTQLKGLYGKRMRFTGTVGRISQSKIYGDKTVMLRDIKTEEGEWVAHHIWFKNAVWCTDKKIKIGQIFSFNADVVRYKKRDKRTEGNKIYDFKLVNAGMINLI